IADKNTALDTLVREELGLDPEELGGSAATAALSSFALFAFGAFFPVAPFAVLSGPRAVLASLALSGLALGGIAAATSLFTGRGLAWSAARQVLFGFIAAGVTYGVGALVGATLG